MAASPRRRTSRALDLRFAGGVVLYLASLLLASWAGSVGVAAWIPGLLAVPAAGIMAWANVDMNRSGDAFERRKVAEAVLFAFAMSAPVLLAVGVLQLYLLPELNWIFAFSVLMLMWI